MATEAIEKIADELNEAYWEHFNNDRTINSIDGLEKPYKVEMTPGDPHPEALYAAIEYLVEKGLIVIQ